VTLAVLVGGGPGLLGISPGFGAGLPDGRAWEMVSPADKHGGFIRPLLIEDAVQGSSDGSAFAFLSEQSLFAESKGSAVFDEVLARRTSEGWRAEDLAVPHDLPPGQGIGQGQEYRLFSPDLSLALVQPFGPFTPLAPEATERTPYLRTNASGSYEPLLTPADVPPGTTFGGEPTASVGPVDILGATPDLGHVVLHTTELALTAAPATNGLYEWSSGRIRLVSQLPESAGGAPIEGTLGAQNEQAEHAISDNGSRVFWEGEPEGERHLYVRDTSTETTAQLDVVQPGAAGGFASPRFQYASADGSMVFFTDEEQLTTNSGTSGRDLYECILHSEGPGPLACELIDLTPAQGGHNAELPRISVLGASEDGTYLYVRAHGVLATNENEATGEIATEEANNLYLLHNTGSEWTRTFIATLAGEDTENALRALTARASSDGRFFAFMSNRSITGYDNNDANSGQPDEEVYLYRVARTPHLICASCNPSGARPLGALESGQPTLPNFNLVDEPATWEGSWIAANVPTQEDFGLGEARYQPRYLSDSGRLFFNTSDALVPQDANGGWDVYQYEPAGVGSCTPGGEGFSTGKDGCVNLISSGTSIEESAFMGASETGSDVFFLTAAKLTTQDADEQVDIYDAHECTSSSPCVQPPATAPLTNCQGAAECRPESPGQTPGDGTAASETLSGPGNLTPQPPSGRTSRPLTRAQKLAKALRSCRSRHRRSRRTRRACERRAKALYGPPKHSRQEPANRSRSKR
jgi:hypothetical protein